MENATLEDQERKFFRELLFHAENLQHNRVYYFLVAETVFFLAATAAISHKSVFIILTLAGIAISILFAIINLKNYLRILWLISSLRNIDEIYDRYIIFSDFPKLVTLRCFTLCFYSKFIDKSVSKQSIPSPDIAEPLTVVPIGPPQWSDTGILLSWGLSLTILITWLLLLIYGIFCLPQ
jgi:hypothetical protein